MQMATTFKFPATLSRWKIHASSLPESLHLTLLRIADDV